MAIIHGSLSYTLSGRKRKVLRKKTKAKVYYSSLKIPSYDVPGIRYPSVEDFGHCTGKTDASFKKEISSKYTVAPAYNKGAYQVISVENVKDIGR